MPLPRTILLAAALTAAVAAPPGALARDGEVVIATSGDVPAAVAPDGSRRYDLPFLRPGDRDVAVSPDGGRVAFSSDRSGEPEIFVADLTTGVMTRITRDPSAADRRPAWSPDGRRLVWDSGPEGAADLVTAPLDGSPPVALTDGLGDDIAPAWSPDGREIAYTSSRDGTRGLWIVPAEGGEPRRVAVPAGVVRAPSWSPDGGRIAFALGSLRTPRARLLTVAVASGRLTRVTGGAVTDADPDWSPDGRSLTFARSTGGVPSVLTVPAGGGAVRLVGGTVGYGNPDWSRAGRGLVAVPEKLPDLDQRAPTEVGVTFRAGQWRLGFASSTENIGDGPMWIRGTRPPGRRSMRADQLVELRGGGVQVTRGVGRLDYEPHQPHFHWHFEPFMRTELRSARDFRLLVRDRKIGFCMVDRYGRALTRIPGVGPPRFTGDCSSRRPDARTAEMGSSRGYIDYYPAYYHGQDISLRGVPAGTYVLVQRANPENRMREVRYGNNAASVLIRISRPGSGAPSVSILRRCESSERCGPR